MGLPLAPPVRLSLFLPHPESKLCAELAHGSAIVGLPVRSGEVRIYYEGNVIGAANLNLLGHSLENEPEVNGSREMLH